MMPRDWMQWLAELLPVLGAGGLGGWLFGRRRQNAEINKIESEARVLLDKMTWDRALATIGRLENEVNLITEARATRDREIVEMRAVHTEEIKALRQEIAQLRDEASKALTRSEASERRSVENERRSQECEAREKALQARVAELERQVNEWGSP